MPSSWRAGRRGPAWRSSRLLVAATVGVGLLSVTALPASANAFRTSHMGTPSTTAGSLVEIAHIGHVRICGSARYAQPDGSRSIAAGPDGALWFAGGCIGRMTTTGQVTNVYKIRSYSITPGPDGAMWFTLDGNPGSIGRIALPALPPRSTPTRIASSITTYPVSGAPQEITMGPDGAMWFTTIQPAAIGRITMSGSVTEYPVANSPHTMTITAGPDGALWYTTFNFATPHGPAQATVNRMTTSGVVTASYLDPNPSAATDITTGPDGALWFASLTAAITPASSGFYSFDYPSIERMTLAGVFNDYPLAETGLDGPEGITTGPDGALWFTSQGHPGDIGRITTSGVITNCTSSALGIPSGITTGPDGAIWFTNYLSHTIGRVPNPPAFTC